jgi:hypothetical protein
VSAPAGCSPRGLGGVFRLLRGLLYVLSRNALVSWCVLSFFIRGLAFCGRAPEPRAHEVDQSLGRLLSFDPHAPSLGKGGGVGNVVLPSSGEFRRSPVSC